MPVTHQMRTDIVAARQDSVGSNHCASNPARVTGEIVDQLFSCKTIIDVLKKMAEFRNLRQLVILWTSKLAQTYRTVGFVPENKVFGTNCPTQDETMSGSVES
jgi:hypothetical protein